MRGSLEGKIPSVAPTKPLEIGIGVAKILIDGDMTIMEIDNMSTSDVDHWFNDVIVT